MASKYANKQFWVDTLDRAVATVAQTGVATLTAGVTGILEVDWVTIGSVAGLAGAVSVLTSIAFRGSPAPEPAVLYTEADSLAQLNDDGPKHAA